MPRIIESKYDGIRDAVLDRWVAGEDSAIIGAAFRIDVGRVNGIVRVARRDGDARAVPRAGGHHPATDEILKRWVEGQKTDVIAEAVSLTPKQVRSVVCVARGGGDSRAVMRGMSHDHRARSQIRVQMASEADEDGPEACEDVRVTLVRSPSPEVDEDIMRLFEPRQTDPDPVKPLFDAYGLMDLGPRSCRFPTAEDPEVRGRHFFCGRRKVIGRSYCADHMRRILAFPSDTPEAA